MTNSENETTIVASDIDLPKSESAVRNLLSRAKSGATSEMGELLQLYRNYLTVLATTQISGGLRKRVSPSDIVQETMLAAHCDIGDFRGSSEREFLAWLRQVLLNTIYRAVDKHVKAQRRDVRREISLEQLCERFDKSAANLAHEFAVAGPSPSGPLRHREVAVMVANQLAKLRPQYRDVIVLRNLQELSFEEVGQRMDRSKGACRILWLRAMEKLKEVFADEGMSMVSLNSLDVSGEPSVLRDLSAEQQDRLGELLDEYLSNAVDGVLPDEARLVSENPDLKEPLTLYLNHIRRLHNVAAGFSNPLQDANCSSESAAATPEEMSRDSDEKRIGDFILEEEIGRGGMGVVYKARQVSLRRDVALKLLPFAAVLNTKQIARFKNEAQSAAQVRHPNIVPVFAIGAERGVHYYAMELIDGQPLDRAIAELRGNSTRRIEPSKSTRQGQTINQDTTCNSFLTAKSKSSSDYYRTVADVGVQAAVALHAAHEYGVVHRDIKPSNLLLDEGGKLWVTDFGLARCQSEKNLTRTGDVMGTVRYMSPEQALGKPAMIDERTDVYGLGATLYELATLRACFPDDESRDVFRRIEYDEPTPLRHIRPDIPLDLESVILKAIAKQREDRYTTAQEFADDLQRVIDGRSTIAKPPTILDKASKWARRHQKALLTTTVVSSFLVVVLLASTLMVAGARYRAEQNLRQKSEAYDYALEVVEFGDQLSERLAAVPGAEDIRGELQQKQLEFYTRLASQQSNDLQRQADIARTYGKIGTIQSRIGSPEEAINAHQDSIDVFSRLLEKAPKNVEYRRQLALSHNNLGVVLMDFGQLDEASNSFDRALTLQADLTRRHPDEPSFVSDFALTHVNMGMLRRNQNKVELALISFGEALEIQCKLLDADSQDAEYIRRLAATHNNIGAVMGDSRDALQHHRNAVELLVGLIELEPKVPEHRSSLATTYNNIGTLLSRSDDLAGAKQEYLNAIDAQRQLTEDYPRNQAFQSDLAFTLNNLALTQNRIGKTADAIESFRQAVYTQKRLTAQDPTDVNNHGTLAGIYNNLGIVLESQARFQEASKAFDYAIEHQLAAFEAAPDASSFRMHLSKHYYNHARVLRRLDMPIEAAELALRRKELWPNDSQKLVSVAEELALAVQILRANSRLLDANELADTAIATLERAVACGWKPETEQWPKVFDSLQRSKQIQRLFSQTNKSAAGS